MSVLDENFIEKNSSKHSIHRRNIVWLIIFATGFIFKILHWPGASIILLFSAGGLFASALDNTVRFKGKDIPSLIITFVSLIWMLSVLYSFVIGSDNSLGLKGVILPFAISAIVFTIYRWIGRQK